MSRANLEYLGRSLLKEIEGPTAERGGLIETPARFAKAIEHWFDGYGKDPKDVLKAFEDGAENYDEMVWVKDISVWSHCEHHIAPFFGVAHCAYVPKGRVVGLSKMARLVDIFAHRLQVQERLTAQIADALEKYVSPDVGVVLECRHSCMESRGVQRAGSVTVTSALRGDFKTHSTRQEFLALALRAQ